MIMNAYLVRKYSYAPAQRRRTTMVLDGQRMGDERDWVLVGFFVTCSSSAEKRFIRLAKQDEMGLCESEERGLEVVSTMAATTFLALRVRHTVPWLDTTAQSHLSWTSLPLISSRQLPPISHSPET